MSTDLREAFMWLLYEILNHPHFTTFIAIGLGLGPLIILRAFKAKEIDQLPYCKSCQYCLKGLEEAPTCVECGADLEIKGAKVLGKRKIEFVWRYFVIGAVLTAISWGHMWGTPFYTQEQNQPTSYLIRRLEKQATGSDKIYIFEELIKRDGDGLLDAKTKAQVIEYALAYCGDPPSNYIARDVFAYLLEQLDALSDEKRMKLLDAGIAIIARQVSEADPESSFETDDFVILSWKEMLSPFLRQQAREAEVKKLSKWMAEHLGQVESSFLNDILLSGLIDLLDYPVDREDALKFCEWMEQVNQDKIRYHPYPRLMHEAVTKLLAVEELETSWGDKLTVYEKELGRLVIKQRIQDPTLDVGELEGEQLNIFVQDCLSFVAGEKHIDYIDNSALGRLMKLWQLDKLSDMQKNAILKHIVRLELSCPDAIDLESDHWPIFLQRKNPSRMIRFSETQRVDTLRFEVTSAKLGGIDIGHQFWNASSWRESKDEKLESIFSRMRVFIPKDYAGKLSVGKRMLEVKVIFKAYDKQGNQIIVWGDVIHKQVEVMPLGQKAYEVVKGQAWREKVSQALQVSMSQRPAYDDRDSGDKVISPAWVKINFKTLKEVDAFFKVSMRTKDGKIYEREDGYRAIGTCVQDDMTFPSEVKISLRDEMIGQKVDVILKANVDAAIKHGGRRKIWGGEDIVIKNVLIEKSEY